MKSLNRFLHHRLIAPAVVHLREQYAFVSRCLFAFVLIPLCQLTASAQTGNVPVGDIPRLVSYQGTLADKSGKPLDSVSIPMVVSLYSDDQGTNRVWQGAYTPAVSKGVFGIQLGSGNYPLPKGDALGRALWLGIAVGGSAELRPLTPVAASAYALNVADNSITAPKMGTDYVSSLQINGQQVTSRGGAANFLPGQGISMSYDSTAQGILINTQTIEQPVSNNTGVKDWGESGNNTVTSGSFVGTSDYSNTNGAGNSQLEIHLDDAQGNPGTFDGNKRVMLYEEGKQSPNLVGGYRGNTVIPGPNGGAVIGGGGYAGNTNIVHGDFGFIGGGANNQTLNVYSTIAGGELNSAGGSLGPAFVGGGYGNTASGYGVIGGGVGNQAGNWGVTGGGEFNWDFADHDFIGGGNGNQIATNVVAGENFDVITGGQANSIGPTIAANAQWSSVGGGYTNTIVGSYSAIPGGRNLLLSNNSFGFNGDNSGTSTNLRINVGGNLAYFGNVNVMIGNVDGTARQLQFYSPNAAGYTYPASSFYTSFQAQTQAANINYILPAAQGAASTVLTNNGAGVLTWGSGSGGAWNLLGNAGTTPGTNFLGTTDSKDLEIHVGGTKAMDYHPAPTTPDIIGGSSANTMLTGVDGATICGGGFAANANTITDNFCFIGGGVSNQAGDNAGTVSDHQLATVGGGSLNKAKGGWAFIGGGFSSTAVGSYDVITGGSMNIIDGTTSQARFIGGGGGNHIYSGNFSSIVGGGGNKSYNTYDAIGGGSGNTTNADYATIAGGTGNTGSGQYGAIIGGSSNSAENSYSVVAGGYDNHSQADKSAVVGGNANFTKEQYGFIGAGQGNTVLAGGLYANIPGGQGLNAQSYSQTILGYYNEKQGSTTGPHTGAYTWKGDDFVLSVGNGTGNSLDPPAVEFHNGFMVSNSGHSIVTHKLGGPWPPLPVGPVTILGATYTDNTVRAWGEIDAAGNVLSGFGIQVGPFGPIANKFIVWLDNMVDPDGNPALLTQGSVTANVEAPDGNTDPMCATISVSPVLQGTYLGHTTNYFVVWTHNLLSGACNPIPLRFTFKVCGR